LFRDQKPYKEVPSGVLIQLGSKVQHALTTSTAKDRQLIKQAADNYPLLPLLQNLSSDYWREDRRRNSHETKRESDLHSVCGDYVSGLNAPRMDPLAESEIEENNGKSKFVNKYCELIDRESE
jgi:hypothetical protein